MPELDSDFDCLVEKVQVENLLVLTFASEEYGKILDNWLWHMDRIGVANVLVIAFDEATLERLRSAGRSAYLVPFIRPVDDLAQMWQIRVKVLHHLTETGVNWVHSDVDAVWFADPIGRFFRGADADIVASQGTVWPRKAYAAWGFTLCCGLMFTRSSARTVDIWERVVGEVLKARDDQAAFNRVVLEDQIDWTINDGYAIQVNGKPVRASNSIIVGQGNTSKIHVLPHHLFQRVHIPDSSPWVRHPLSMHAGGGTERALRKAGCWLNPYSDELNDVYRKEWLELNRPSPTDRIQ